MNIVLFSPEEIGKPLSLRDERAEHIRKVLRKKEGDRFEAGITDGPAGSALITGISKEGLSFAFTPEEGPRELYPVRLLVGFPRPIQLKRLLRDASSLGAEEIHLMGTELGEKSYMKSTLVERGAAQASLIEGTAQAKGTCVPRLYIHESVSACCDTLKDEPGLRFAMDNVGPEFALTGAMPLGNANANLPVYVAIGSERGWTERERKQLEQAGFTRCGMGTRVLRTETAVTAALAIILARIGLM